MRNYGMRRPEHSSSFLVCGRPDAVRSPELQAGTTCIVERYKAPPKNIPRKCSVEGFRRQSCDTFVACLCFSEKSSISLSLKKLMVALMSTIVEKRSQTVACCHYLPAGIVCLLTLLARWHYMPASTTCPLAILARWRYMPASTMCPLALLACWQYLPAGATCPLALRAR